MNSLKEIWESLTERFKNPAVYAFTISWIVINYKITLAILSEESFTTKVKYIDSIITPDGVLDAKKLIYLPAVTAAVYIFVIPAFSLITTWTNAIYERWHSNIRARESRLGILTKAQREQLEEEISDLNNRLRLEAQKQTDARQASDQRISVVVNRISERTLKGYFLMLQESAPKWTDQTIHPPSGRTVKGGEPYQGFVEKYGIPVNWARVFEQINQSNSISSTELASRISTTDAEAMDILIGLSALTMLKPTWENGDLRFELIESSWVALLNGRPA